MSLCQMPPKLTVSSRQLRHRDDLGEPVDARHERVLDRFAEPAGERLEVAPARASGRGRTRRGAPTTPRRIASTVVVGQRAREVDAADHRAERRLRSAARRGRRRRRSPMRMRLAPQREDDSRHRSRRSGRSRTTRCRPTRTTRKPADAGVDRDPARPAQAHARVPRGRHRARDGPARRAAPAVVVRGRRLRDVHGPPRRGHGAHAGEQGADRRRISTTASCSRASRSRRARTIVVELRLLTAPAPSRPRSCRTGVTAPGTATTRNAMRAVARRDPRVAVATERQHADREVGHARVAERLPGARRPPPRRRRPADRRRRWRRRARAAAGSSGSTRRARARGSPTRGRRRPRPLRAQRDRHARPRRAAPVGRADSAARRQARHHVLADGALVRHPEDRAGRELTRDAQHHRRERGEEHRRRDDVGHVEGVVHPEVVVLDVDAAGARERGVRAPRGSCAPAAPASRTAGRACR